MVRKKDEKYITINLPVCGRKTALKHSFIEIRSRSKIIINAQCT